MEIVFATNNRHKLTEIRAAAPDKLHISGLNEKGIVEDIPETSDTLEGNAIEKAMYIYSKYGFNCFADDTGLEVEALDGRPGVYSARYAGEGCTFEDNVNKLLREMEGVSNRRAVFRTVIAYVDEGKLHTFEGSVEGIISLEKKGKEGFGYDPVFIPEKQGRSFAEMSLNEKNMISHRARAMKKFIDFLNDYYR